MSDPSLRVRLPFFITSLALSISLLSTFSETVEARPGVNRLPTEIKSTGYHSRLYSTKPLAQDIGIPLPPPRKPKPKHSGLVYADGGQWDKLAAVILQQHDPAMKKLLTWLYIKSPDSHAQYTLIRDFLKNNPEWPHRSTLVQRTEEALMRNASDKDRSAWFSNGHANTLEGELWIISQSPEAQSEQRIRRVWRDYSFTQQEEKDFLQKYGTSLRTVDHEARLNRLIWTRNLHEARRQLRRLPLSYRIPAESRIAFATRSRRAAALFERIPKQFIQDPGVVYERIRWNRRRGKEDKAAQLLLDYKGARPYPDRWWTETSILTRDAIRKKQFTVAYRLASHTSHPGIQQQAEAQWLSGWIAFEHLKDYKAAQKHFQAFTNIVKTPVSRARGAYWLGRCAEKLNAKLDAQAHYKAAATYSTTFYGQRATQALNLPQSLPSHTSTIPTEAMTWVSEHELSNVLWRLHENQEHKLFRTFARALYNRADSEARKRAVIASIAPLSLGDSVHLARVMRQQGILDLELTYPTPDWIELPSSPDKALIYSVIRQESNFDTHARSPVGATGLMQIMPQTAKHEARLMKRAFSLHALTQSPNTNVAIGSHYLQRLLDIYDGHIPLALAAYNAGASNVKKWLQDYGDPRKGEISMLQWIESIPFRETRNYVQRILENREIYQALMVKK